MLMPIPTIEAPLIIPRGDDRTYVCSVKDKEGVVINITGSSISFSVRRDYDDLLVLISKSSTQIDEIELTNPTGGAFKIYLVPVDTQGMAGNYKFDIEIILSTGKVYTPIIGDFIVQRTIT